jgi:enediyne biosynthesis protein E4
LKTAARIQVFVIGGMMILLLGFLLRSFKTEETTRSQEPAPPTNAATEPNYQAIVRELDETVWAPELLGQKHAAIIETLWDQIKNSETPFKVLLSLPFKNLTLGTFESSQSLPHHIDLQFMGKPREILTAEDRHNQFQFLENESFQLEQSEWRHERFWPSLEGAAQSQFSFTLHILKPSPEIRYILRGTLQIRWRDIVDGISEGLDSVTVTKAELLSRKGPTPFGHVIPADVTPTQDAFVFEPNLQLNDLDQNGLADIVLSRINRVYWNQGQGQFKQTPLCDFPAAFLHNGLFEDFNGDGHTDFLAVGTEELSLFVGTPEGKFPSAAITTPIGDGQLENPFVMTAADIDSDHDLDLWLAQYKSPYQGGQMPTPVYDANDGHPSFLLLNDGTGHFTDGTEAAGLHAKRHRRTYSASFVDFDSDQDQDLIVVSDFSGLDIHENIGNGTFIDATDRLVKNRHAFGMAHTFGDFDHNGEPDILMIGMNAPTADRLNHLGLSAPQRPDYATMRPAMTTGNRLLFQKNQSFIETETSQQVARTGWSWGVAAGDFDNDGDEDIYIVNGHITGASVRDYEKDFWLYDTYLGNSTENENLNRFFEHKQSATRDSGASFGGHELNRFFLNLGQKGFVEIAYLMGLSLSTDCRNLVCEDLDGDGRLEWITSTFETWPEPKQALHLFPNFTETSGNWIGIRLKGAPGVSIAGTTVHLSTAKGQQTRYLVNGDSYRSQSANSVHFGIGNEKQVKDLLIRWPSGENTVMGSPQINTYHQASPSDQPSISN